MRGKLDAQSGEEVRTTHWAWWSRDSLCDSLALGPNSLLAPLLASKVQALLPMRARPASRQHGIRGFRKLLQYLEMGHPSGAIRGLSVFPEVTSLPPRSAQNQGYLTGITEFP